MAKVKNYKPQNFIMATIILVVMFLVFGVAAFSAAGVGLLIFYLCFVVPLLIVLVRRKISIFDESIEIISGFSKTTLKFSQITKLTVELLKPKFSAIGVPTLMIYSNLGKRDVVKLMYRPYARADLAEIINFILSKNERIKKSNDVISIMEGKENNVEIVDRKGNKLGLLWAGIAILIYIAVQRLALR